jgi:nucleotide-binding universal stress UspA family protein
VYDNILVAIDLTEPPAQHVLVVLGGALHLLTVNPATSFSVAPAAALDEFRRTGAERRKTMLYDFASDHPRPCAPLHVQTGDVTEVIDEMVSAYDIGVSVIGTAARSGLQQLFVGNTAETVLDRLGDTDIIIVADPETG